MFDYFKHCRRGEAGKRGSGEGGCGSMGRKLPNKHEHSGPIDAKFKRSGLQGPFPVSSTEMIKIDIP